MSTTDTAILVAAISLGAAILAAIVNQLGNWLTAGRSLKAQRVLANDAARREWRRSLIEPALKNAAARASNVDLLRRALYLEDREQASVLVKSYRALEDSYSTSLLATVPGHEQQEVLARFFRSSDDACSALIDWDRLRIKSEGNVEQADDRALQASVQMHTALAELHDAVERYLFHR
jgi:hypothetical protein